LDKSVHGKEGVNSQGISRSVIYLEEEQHGAGVGGGRDQAGELHAECEIQVPDGAISPTV
jgi:hypothetical protein